MNLVQSWATNLAVSLAVVFWALPTSAQVEPRSPDARAYETRLMLDQQNRRAAEGSNPLYNQNSLQTGQARAEQMAEMIKTEEMEKALIKVTERGQSTLRENPSLKTPLGVIAGAMGLWMGNTVRLFKGDELKITSRIEGRNRSSEFNMESPLLNGRFRFSADQGFEVHMNRAISSINSRAELNYNIKNQTFSTSIRKRIAPNLDFSFGAAQFQQHSPTDGNARLEYQFNF
jgi:hypothetical protein